MWPNWLNTISNDASSYGKASTSPSLNSISTPASAVCFLPCSPNDEAIDQRSAIQLRRTIERRGIVSRREFPERGHIHRASGRVERQRVAVHDDERGHIAPQL
ncbi:MAG: hypothetical protein ABIR94_11395 [Rubrivivax sp.]